MLKKCPNCNQLIKPDDFRNKTYIVLGSYFDINSNKEFTIVVQCKCGQDIHINVSGFQLGGFKNYQLRVHSQTLFSKNEME